MSIPTLIWLHDGTEAARLDGLIREPDLEAAFTTLTASDEQSPSQT
jgi:hypothetical protein